MTPPVGSGDSVWWFTLSLEGDGEVTVVKLLGLGGVRSSRYSLGRSVLKNSTLITQLS
jgi:hypothetical protein